MIIYTHLFNAFAMMTSFVICVVGSLLLFLGKTKDFVFLPLPPVVRGILAILWLMGAGWFCLKKLYPASNWLYLLIFRRTLVTFAEAVELSPLFYLNNMKWYPMREIDSLPKEQRVPYMRTALANLRAQGKIRK